MLAGAEAQPNANPILQQPPAVGNQPAARNQQPPQGQQIVEQPQQPPAGQDQQGQQHAGQAPPANLGVTLQYVTFLIQNM